MLAGAIRAPADLNPATLVKASYRGPAMLWIDPVKEIEAQVLAVDNTLTSPQQIIRKRGDNPDDVLKQTDDWNRQLDSLYRPAQARPKSLRNSP